MTASDLGAIARRLAEGDDLSTIAAALDGPPGPPPEEQAATQGRRQLQAARGALNAEAAPLGTEPDEDPIAEQLSRLWIDNPRWYVAMTRVRMVH